MLGGRDRQIGRFAWVMAWVGLVVGQLHALARAATAEGAEDWQYPLFAAWGRPASDLLSPLLDWGSADPLYVHYGKIWFPVVAAFTLCAFVVYRRRQPTGFEKWMWRANLGVYAALCVGVFLSYWTQWTGNYDDGGIEQALFTVGTWFDFLGLGLMLLVGTTLGVTLLIKRFRPVLPAVLLAVLVPAMLGITQVTSLGSVTLPVAFAFAILGRRIARAEEPGSDGVRRQLSGEVGVGPS